MTDNSVQLFTITVFTENQVGLIHQISIIFTRRGLNINSILGSPSSVEGVHKFTITCMSTRRLMELVARQIEKRIDVLKAYVYTDDEIVYQEVALYKVPTGRLLDESRLEEIIRRHNARILDINRTYTVLEKTGHFSETEALLNELRAYGLLQFARTGRVAVTKSAEEPIREFLAGHKG